MQHLEWGDGEITNLPDCDGEITNEDPAQEIVREIIWEMGDNYKKSEIPNPSKRCFIKILMYFCECQI